VTTSIRRSSWIVTIPLAAAAVAYVTLSFLPDRRAIGEARRQIRQKQQYIVQSGGLATVLRSAEEELKKTQAYNAAWGQHAPVEAELSAVHGKIQELAKASGTTITRFDPEPAVRYEKISHFPIGVGCVGSLAEICGFLERLESLPTRIWVKDLLLKETGKDGNPILCELNLGIFANNLENSDYVEHND
jgi:Tfp pilus assembly protein PilO